MTEKRLNGGSARCGKTINQYTCPECRVPLLRLDTTLFQCPMCLKKVKAIAKELPSDYGYYTNNQVRKRIEELFKHKTLNCKDRIKSDRMTEKRFNMEYVYGNPTIWHITDCGEHIVDEKICDLLNALNDENEKLKTQLMENNCDNCKYSKAIYADVECRKKGLTEWKCNCDEFNGDLE